MVAASGPLAAPDNLMDGAPEERRTAAGGEGGGGKGGTTEKQNTHTHIVHIQGQKESNDGKKKLNAANGAMAVM